MVADVRQPPILTLACLDSIDPVYVILGSSIMFDTLKGLEIFSRPSISQKSLYFFGNFDIFWCDC